jgi:hypothetical protein
MLFLTFFENNMSLLFFSDVDSSLRIIDYF